ncbi:unnamed protein product [Closterium sp. NIES-53]
MPHPLFPLRPNPALPTSCTRSPIRLQLGLSLYLAPPLPLLPTFPAPPPTYPISLQLGLSLYLAPPLLSTSSSPPAPPPIPHPSWLCHSWRFPTFSFPLDSPSSIPPLAPRPPLLRLFPRSLLCRSSPPPTPPPAPLSSFTSPPRPAPSPSQAQLPINPCTPHPGPYTPHSPPRPAPSPSQAQLPPTLSPMCFTPHVLIPLLAGFPISPINPHLGISASGSVPPGAALLLCDDVAAEGSFLLLHLLKSHLLSPPLQGGGAGARQGEGQGEGGCRGGGEGCVRTVCLIALAHPPAHYSHVARRMHRLAIIDGQSQAYTWQPDGLDPRVCLQQENQKEMPHQDQQQKEMPLQQQQQQQQAGVYRFSPPVPFSPPPHPPSQTLPSNGYPPHSANASPLRALYSSICAAVSPIGCPHSSQPAHTPSHPSQPPSHPTEPFSRTAPPATTQPAAGSGAGAATSPSPSGAADVAPPARCGGQLCIIIDDVSLLETCAGGDSRLVMDFLSACRGLCTKHHRTELNVHAFHHRFVGLSLSPPFRGLKPFTTVSWA